MNEIFPMRRLVAEPVVRLRCLQCEVAWSGQPKSTCWVCGDVGTSLNTALAARERSISAFELDLLY